MPGSLNTKGVQEQGNYKLPPKDKYDVEIVEVIAKTTKNKDPMIVVKLNICSGDYQGCYLWDNITLSDNPNSPGYSILGRTKRFLHCLGEEYEGEFNWDENNWLGKIVKIRLDHEPPNEYHDYKKAIVAQYILDEELSKKDPIKEYLGDGDDDGAPF